MSDSANIFEASAENFDEVVLGTSARTPVLVDFWAAWCGPCQVLMPILAKLVDEYQGKFILVKVNADEQAPLAAQYGVRSLPTVKLLKDGQVVDEFLGAQPESAIRAILDRHIERASDKVREDALAALRAGDLSKALTLIGEAGAMDPDNTRVQIDAARILSAAGEHDQAAEKLERLPLDWQSKSEVEELKATLAFRRIAAGGPDAATLERWLTAEPDNSGARYQLSAHKVVNGDYEGAMDLLLELMRRDRSFGDDAARKRLLDIFTLLGAGSELVNRYRSKMSALIY